MATSFEVDGLEKVYLIYWNSLSSTPLSLLINGQVSSLYLSNERYKGIVDITIIGIKIGNFVATTTVAVTNYTVKLTRYIIRSK